MKATELRSKIHLYGAHPTAGGLNKIMDAIETYAAQRVAKIAEGPKTFPSQSPEALLARHKTKLSSEMKESNSNIKSGPYWDKVKELKQ